jgi:choline dehydrogenase-like flavoprotein
MFLVADSIRKDSVVSADVCVVGSGAAGLAFLREFVTARTRIHVLESGGFAPAIDPDPLYDLECPRLPVARDSRVRTFGGTTSVWSGCWKRLDAIDFEARPWVPDSGWPIGGGDLDPYYGRASRSLEGPDREETPPGASRFLEKGVVEPAAFVFQPRSRRRWGPRSRRALERSQTITVHLDAHVVKLEARGGAAIAARVRTLGGNAFSVEAGAFVLAAGAIENARLLLLSDIGNERDQVGRYYMDHPRGQIGTIEGYRSLDLSDIWDVRTLAGRTHVGFRLADEVQERCSILNSHVFLEPVPQRLPLVWRWPVARTAAALHRVRSSPIVAVHNHLEQAPIASNRVRLGEATDPLGNPKPRIEWSLGELDRRTIAVFHELLREQLQRARMGELDSELLDRRSPAFDGLHDASHSMGTTRMGHDPATSVVDRDCKVHGIRNLFIAGSSVFPTGGHANPTATIAALAIRLADHVKART